MKHVDVHSTVDELRHYSMTVVLAERLIYWQQMLVPPPNKTSGLSGGLFPRTGKYVPATALPDFGAKIHGLFRSNCLRLPCFIVGPIGQRWQRSRADLDVDHPSSLLYYSLQTNNLRGHFHWLPGVLLRMLLSWFSCCGVPVLKVLLWCSCPQGPVVVLLSSCSCCGAPVLILLLFLSLYSGPWYSCRGCTVLVLRSRCSCPDSFISGAPILVLLHFTGHFTAGRQPYSCRRFFPERDSTTRFCMSNVFVKIPHLGSWFILQKNSCWRSY